MNDIFFPRNRSLPAQPLEVTTQPPTFLYSKSLSFFFFGCKLDRRIESESIIQIFRSGRDTHKKKVWTNERSHRSGHVTHCQKSRFLVLRPLFHSDQLIFPLISDLWTVEKKLFLFFSNFRWTPSVGCGCNSSSWVIIVTSRLHVRHTRITMTILRVCFSSSFVVHSSTHVDRVEARNKFWKKSHLVDSLILAAAGVVNSRLNAF